MQNPLFKNLNILLNLLVGLVLILRLYTRYVSAALYLQEGRRTELYFTLGYSLLEIIVAVYLWSQIKQFNRTGYLLCFGAAAYMISSSMRSIEILHTQSFVTPWDLIAVYGVSTVFSAVALGISIYLWKVQGI